MKGKITITRFQSTDAPYQGIHIELNDETSSTRMVDIYLTPEQYGEAISGIGWTGCEFILGNTSLAGKVREHVVVQIPKTWKGYRPDESEIERILQGYEVDGWIARRDDFQNHHKYNNDSVSVTFIRYTEAT